MKRRYLIWAGSVGALAVLAACQSGSPAASAQPEQSQDPEAIAPARTAPAQPIVAQRGSRGKAPAAVDVSQAGFDVGQGDILIDEETGFAIAAFPPTIPDREWHRDAWIKDDCLRCHETGVQEAPMIRHRGLPEITFESKCRSCHILVPGKTEMVARYEEESEFEEYAFPPMIPNSVNHAGAWTTENCMLCHETGIRGAPVVEHVTLPEVALTAKCRTCHVQVRSVDSPWEAR